MPAKCRQPRPTVAAALPASLRKGTPVLHGAGMQVGSNPGGGVRPGPCPVFTERLIVKVRPEQLAAVQRIARVLHRPASDVVRWFIDTGVAAIDQAPTYQLLEEGENCGD